MPTMKATRSASASSPPRAAVVAERRRTATSNSPSGRATPAGLAYGSGTPNPRIACWEPARSSSLPTPETRKTPANSSRASTTSTSMALPLNSRVGPPAAPIPTGLPKRALRGQALIHLSAAEPQPAASRSTGPARGRRGGRPSLESRRRRVRSTRRALTSASTELEGPQSVNRSVADWRTVRKSASAAVNVWSSGRLPRSTDKKTAFVTGGPGVSGDAKPGITVRSILSPTRDSGEITSPLRSSSIRDLSSSLIGRGKLKGRSVWCSIRATSSV